MEYTAPIANTSWTFELMLLGRILGWVLIAVAVVMASADAVMALGPADYSGLVTADLMTLLTGAEHEAPVGTLPLWYAALLAIMDMPAWVLTGGVGAATLYATRKKQRRHRFRPS